MASIVSICNLALANLAKDKIDDLSEPTAEARACNLFYDHVRDTLLQVYPWNFASKTQSLSAVTNDKAGEWSYAYSRPNDCLKVRRVVPEYSDAEPRPVAPSPFGFPHDVDSGLIYCDLSPALLQYTYKLIDPSRYSPMFVEALAWHLSVRLAMPLTRDPKVRADAYQLAMQTQNAAAMADANEVRENSDHESELVTERG